MANFTFDRVLKVIQVDSPVKTITVQELLDAVRNYEDELISLDLGKIANAAGKEELSEGIFVGITVELINDWRVQFEARGSQVFCYIRGGNLVATNVYGDNPIKASTNVNVIMELSTSAALIEGDAGGGGGGSTWTEAEKAQIRDALGIDGDRVAAMEGQLQNIKTETDKLSDIKIETDKLPEIQTETDRIQEVIDDVDGVEETLEVLESGMVVKIRKVTYTNETDATQARVDRFGEYHEAEPGETIEYEIQIRNDVYG